MEAFSEKINAEKRKEGTQTLYKKEIIRGRKRKSELIRINQPTTKYQTNE